MLAREHAYHAPSQRGINRKLVRNIPYWTASGRPIDPAQVNVTRCGLGEPAEHPVAANRAERRLELLVFAVLAILIWPVVAVGVVGGWGFAVWMYQQVYGPPARRRVPDADGHEPTFCSWPWADRPPWRSPTHAWPAASSIVSPAATPAPNRRSASGRAWADRRCHGSSPPDAPVAANASPPVRSSAIALVADRTSA